MCAMPITTTTPVILLFIGLCDNSIAAACELSMIITRKYFPFEIKLLTDTADFQIFENIFTIKRLQSINGY
jgi:hypothetical protein